MATLLMTNNTVIDNAIKNIRLDKLNIETVVKESKALAHNYRNDFRNREIESDKKLNEYFKLKLSPTVLFRRRQFHQ